MIKITESDKRYSAARHLSRTLTYSLMGDRRGRQGSALSTKEITQGSTVRNAPVLLPKLIWCSLADAEKCQYRSTPWLDYFSPNLGWAEPWGFSRRKWGSLWLRDGRNRRGRGRPSKRVGKRACRAVSPHLSFLCSAPKQGFPSGESEEPKKKRLPAADT